MDFEGDVRSDTSYALWQTIAKPMGGQDLANIRAVCRVSRKAIDDAVTAIAVPFNALHGALPKAECFPDCTQYAFINHSEYLPQYVRQCCGPPSQQKTALVCVEAC